MIKAKDGWIEHGMMKDKLEKKVLLKSGMVLHIPEGEWHIFRYNKGGFVDIIFMYSQIM